MLRIRVLGSAAGGGVPQWNCGCDVCTAARTADGRVRPRTQSSLAVSGDGEHWSLLNCSPDIRQQIADNPPLWPRADRGRDTPISSVVLTNADVDHIAGLLILREKQSFDVFATAAVFEVLAQNPIFNVLDDTLVHRRRIGEDKPAQTSAGVNVEPFRVPGKVALYNEQEMLNRQGRLDIGAVTDDTIGLKITGGQPEEAFFYIPGCAMMTDELASRLAGASLVLFDGTVWQDDEMTAQGLGAKTGARMGHMSMAGAGGSLAAFADIDVSRKVFVHINNTNPALIENSPERRAISKAGWEVAHDGMEFFLP